MTRKKKIKKILKQNLNKMDFENLIDLYTESVQWWHYCATDEWDNPSQHPPSIIRESILNRYNSIYNNLELYRNPSYEIS